MPTTGRSPGRRRKTPVITTEKLEDDGDLETIEPPKVQKPLRKVVNVSTIISETLTDRLSATASYAIANSTLESMGPEYSISPKEAYNITHPTANIIAHYIPVHIKTKLPTDVADNLELILVTLLEYISRISSTWVRKTFNRNLIKHKVLPIQKEMPRPEPQRPISTPQADTEHAPAMTQDDILEMFPEGALPQSEPVEIQVPNGRTGMTFEELMAEGMIVGDAGQNL